MSRKARIVDQHGGSLVDQQRLQCLFAGLPVRDVEAERRAGPACLLYLFLDSRSGSMGGAIIEPDVETIAGKAQCYGLPDPPACPCHQGDTFHMDPIPKS